MTAPHARRKYLDQFPKPLLDDLIAKRWLPIVGAGLSHNATTADGKRPPLWDELGDLVAKQITDGYEYSTPMDALSTYCHLYRMPLLAQLLADLLHVHKARPGPVHEALAQLPFDMIVTTNIDFLLEKSYEKTEYTRVLMDDTDLAVAPHDPGVVDILKIHGDVHNPEHLVVTEEAYDEFLIRYPILATFLANLLVERTAVLVGFSMEDPDLRLIWQIVRARLGNLARPAFAIRVDATGTEVDRFTRRGISVINLRSDEAEKAGARNLDPSREARAQRHGQVLVDVFTELHDYQRERILAASRIHEESVYKQAVIPIGFTTRLCLFAVPSPLHSFYKDFVFPEAVRAGLVPVVEEDIESPGGNIPAEIDSLLARASATFIHVDDTTPTTAFEMRLAKASGQKNIFAVTHKSRGALGDLSPSGRFEYLGEQDLFARADELSSQAASWFAQVAATIEDKLDSLPEDLLKSSALKNDGNFAAALIASYCSLEAELARRVERVPGERPAPLWKLIREARGVLELLPESWVLMEEWWKDLLRILHGGQSYPDAGILREQITKVREITKEVKAASVKVHGADGVATDGSKQGLRGKQRQPRHPSGSPLPKSA